MLPHLSSQRTTTSTTVRTLPPVRTANDLSPPLTHLLTPLPIPRHKEKNGEIAAKARLSSLSRATGENKIEHTRPLSLGAKAVRYNPHLVRATGVASKAQDWACILNTTGLSGHNGRSRIIFKSVFMWIFFIKGRTVIFVFCFCASVKRAIFYAIRWAIGTKDGKPSQHCDSKKEKKQQPRSKTYNGRGQQQTPGLRRQPRVFSS